MATKRVGFRGFKDLLQNFRRVIDSSELAGRTSARISVDEGKAPYAKFVHEDQPAKHAPHHHAPPTRAHFMTAVMESTADVESVLRAASGALLETGRFDQMLEAAANEYKLLTVVLYTPRDTGNLRDSFVVDFEIQEVPILPSGSSAPSGADE